MTAVLSTLTALAALHLAQAVHPEKLPEGSPLPPILAPAEPRHKPLPGGLAGEGVAPATKPLPQQAG